MDAAAEGGMGAHPTGKPVPGRDRFAGCLVGQCLGDALGALVEGTPPGICRSYVARYLAGPDPAPPKGRFPFGQYTDDSQLARELMASYAACRGFDPADYARRLAALFESDRIFGRGMACDQAARRLMIGVPWDQAGEPAGQAGNGSAMRAGPVGVLFADDPDALVRVAVDQGRITHQDPRCAAGSIAIATGVALALEPGRVEPGRWLGIIAGRVEAVSPVVAEGVRSLDGWLRESPGDACGPISTWGYEPGTSPDWPGISPYVVPSVLWSLYAFLRSPEDYLETIRTAIAVGGDVDTFAAMTGAIAGARVGLDALPPGLARRVHDLGEWGYDELVALARECHAVKHGDAGGDAPV